MSGRHILVIDDDPVMRESVVLTLEAEGYAVVGCADLATARVAIAGQWFELALVDVRLGRENGLEFVPEMKAASPETEIIVVTAYGEIRDAVGAIRAGAYDYIAKPFASGEILATVERALERRRLVRRVADLEAQLRRDNRLEEIVGRSPGMIQVLQLVARTARVDSSVLVAGESGTGKELVARAIHANSRRSAGPFVAINCGAIAESLMESELFGHVRGAFTDARTDRKGLLEEAEGGTLFLDEIGELSVATQVTLLRFLQDGQFRRVGDNRASTVDARVVAATNRDLRQAIKEGRFREDLYYRIDVIEISLPPLRERIEDVVPLALRFVETFATRAGRPAPRLTREAVAVPERYPWPGNVRELRNVTERALAFCDEAIEPSHLPGHIVRPDPGIRAGQDKTLAAVEREHVLSILTSTGGNQTRAAQALGIAPSTLWRKLKEYNA